MRLREKNRSDGVEAGGWAFGLQRHVLGGLGFWGRESLEGCREPEGVGELGSRTQRDRKRKIYIEKEKESREKA